MLRRICRQSRVRRSTSFGCTVEVPGLDQDVVEGQGQTRSAAGFGHGVGGGRAESCRSPATAKISKSARCDRDPARRVEMGERDRTRLQGRELLLGAAVARPPPSQRKPRRAPGEPPMLAEQKAAHGRLDEGDDTGQAAPGPGGPGRDLGGQSLACGMRRERRTADQPGAAERTVGLGGRVLLDHWRGDDDGHAVRGAGHDRLRQRQRANAGRPGRTASAPV